MCSVRLWGIHFAYFWRLSPPMLLTLSPIDSWQLFILGIGTPIAVLPWEWVLFRRIITSCRGLLPLPRPRDYHPWERIIISLLHNTSFRPTCYVSNFVTGVLNPLPLYPTKCVHIPVLAKGFIALMPRISWNRFSWTILPERKTWEMLHFLTKIMD